MRSKVHHICNRKGKEKEKQESELPSSLAPAIVDPQEQADSEPAVKPPIIEVQSIGEASASGAILDESTLPEPLSLQTCGEDDNREQIKPETPERPQNAKRDLWHEAYVRLAPELQENLKSLGFDQQSPEPVKQRIEGVLAEAKRQRDKCEEKDWIIKVGDHEIKVRDTAVQIIGWVTKIGDLAVGFAQPAEGPWSVIKLLLGGIEVYDKEKGSLLSIVENVTRVIYSGQIYKSIYKLDKAGVEPTSRLYDVLVELYNFILELVIKSTDVSSNTAVQFLKSVFDPKKASDMLCTLRDHESRLADAVRVCEATAQANLDSLLRIKLEDAHMALVGVTHRIENVVQRMDDQERDKLLSWISDIKYGNHHDHVVERRTPETGTWLIRHETFREWRDSASSGILWLRGYPGTGKTFLTSHVIDHTSANSTCTQNQDFAFFYCYREEELRRKSLHVLRCFVRQLAGPLSDCQSVRISLQEAWRAAKDRGSDLNLDACKAQLLSSFNLYSKTIIVLDALDEVAVNERRQLIRVLDELDSQSTSTVKVFIASRPDGDISFQFASKPNVQIRAADNMEDIDKFIDIRKALLSGCDNMFQWAALHLAQIEQLAGDEDSIYYALNHLPRGLEKTYDQIYGQIQQLAPPTRQKVQNALMWVMFANRPLRSDELLAAIRMNVETGDINLLVVDSKKYVWRLSHLSVVEYFERRQTLLDRPARFNCGSVCLSFLIEAYGKLNDHSASVHPSSSAVTVFPGDKLDINNPFHQYAKQHWPVHFRNNVPDDHSKRILKRFLGSPQESSPYFRHWIQYIFKHQDSFELPYGNGRVSQDDLELIDTPVLAMAWLGLYHPLQEWWEDEHIDLLLENNRGETLIAIAVRVRCEPLCKKLVSRLPKDQRTRGCGCALIIAAKQGDENLVRFLVQEGNANVNLVARGFTTALCEACVIGALNIVKYLVEEAQGSVDVRTECDNYISALAAACHSDSASRLELVKYLLEEAGAVVDPPLVSGLANSALGIASSIGPLDLVKYLVEKGNADVNLQLEGWRCSHGTALAAVIRRRLEIIKYLVTEVHADVNQQLRFGHTNTALTTAVETGSRDIVQLLVEEGNANINLQFTCGGDRNFGSTLEYAIAYSSLIGTDILMYLVSQGIADVNIKPNPLGRAICLEDQQSVQILLSAGASVDFRWNNGSLLRVPNSNLKQIQYSGGGRAEVVDMLRKADPDQWNDEAVEQIPWPKPIELSLNFTMLMFA
ncbi:ankyrin repeat-containing protein [Aspergillus flavus]|uniref:Ankyrin repeat-containing protein n=1 Tax=Aspergillus flavus (strain ATCC 200026 / FGSC A1120 / IAM 13836 / NRRL 3357 / JCM 12722 / SRRC 167) TaxID=332952 RepID=A0A7U2MVP5_ASPFN|nr:ankyrin repeat-containing protein [Aspergillus flavus]